MDIHSPTLHVVCSLLLMRMRKRPGLGGSSGLVRSTMPQEADRGSAEMCQRRPSGTSTTKNTRYKNKPVPAWQGICRNRKYPTEGETVGERWGKTLGLDIWVTCYYSCIVSLVASSTGSLCCRCWLSSVAGWIFRSTYCNITKFNV